MGFMNTVCPTGRNKVLGLPHFQSFRGFNDSSPAPRLGCSLQHLVTTMQDIQDAGADLYPHQQAIDTSTPSGKALFQMCGVFAGFEREMIRERGKAGQEATWLCL